MLYCPLRPTAKSWNLRLALSIKAVKTEKFCPKEGERNADRWRIDSTTTPLSTCKCNFQNCILCFTLFSYCSLFIFKYFHLTHCIHAYSSSIYICTYLSILILRSQVTMASEVSLLDNINITEDLSLLVQTLIKSYKMVICVHKTILALFKCNNE